MDMEQKNSMTLGDITVKMASIYETNYREKSPVVGTIAETNEFLREGQIAVFHHNNFYLPSPYHLYEDLFSVPMGKTIFGVLDENGNINPTFGNMICERIEVETPFPVPPDQKKFHINQYRVLDGGWTVFRKEDTVFTRPHSGYEIIYIWDSMEKRVVKVDSDMVCGVDRPPKK